MITVLNIGNMAEKNGFRISTTFSLVLVKLLQDGPMTTKQISNKLHLSSQNTSIVLKDIENCGFVSKAKGNYDERERIYNLTPKGEFHTMYIVAGMELNKYLGRKSPFHILPDNEDEKQFVDLFKKFTKDLQVLMTKRNKKGEKK